MKYIPSLGALLFAASLAASGGCDAHPDAAQAARAWQPASVARHSVEKAAHTVPGRVPDESAVKELTGNATSASLSVQADELGAPVSDRILNGFQAGVTGLEDGSGHLITWGFKYEEAFFKSVAIYDASGRLLLVAAVNDILTLNTGSKAVYRKALQKEGDPDIRIFSRNRTDLALGHPLLKRWLQAGLVGFNAECAKTKAICMLAEQIDLPTKAYVTSPNGLVQVSVPSVAAASIPLDAFTQ